MLRHVGDFNVRNAFSTQCGFHVHASGQGIGRSSPLHPHDGRGHVVATPHARRSRSDSHRGERLWGSPAYVTPHYHRALPQGCGARVQGDTSEISPATPTQPLVTDVVVTGRVCAL